MMTIKVTDNAKNQIKSLVNDSKFKSPVIRIYSSGVGWRGPKVDLVLEELTNNDQDIIKDNDVNVIFDSNLKNYIKTMPSLAIDYNQDISESGFFIQRSNSCC